MRERRSNDVMLSFLFILAEESGQKLEAGKASHWFKLCPAWSLWQSADHDIITGHTEDIWITVKLHESILYIVTHLIHRCGLCSCPFSLPSFISSKSLIGPQERNRISAVCGQRLSSLCVTAQLCLATDDALTSTMMDVCVCEELIRWSTELLWTLTVAAVRNTNTKRALRKVWKLQEMNLKVLLSLWETVSGQFMTEIIKTVSCIMEIFYIALSLIFLLNNNLNIQPVHTKKS